MRLVDAEWSKKRLGGGLSSGEGLIQQVRDPVTKPGKEGAIVVVDAGESDKRLLLMEGEFAQVLNVMDRTGNTISTLLRNAWDFGDLSTLTRDPLKATGAHISLIGHITQAELLKCLRATECLNGFANRFLWMLVRRSKMLPEGGADVVLDRQAEHLRRAIEQARTVNRLQRSEEARQLWRAVYETLTEDGDERCASIVSRSTAQVVRLSLVYALLDCSSEVQCDHLEAALAIWQYAKQSAQILFGDVDSKETPTSKVLQLLRHNEDGMTRTALHKALSGRCNGEELLKILVKLQDQGLIQRQPIEHKGAGRPSERWLAVRKKEIILSSTTTEAKPTQEPSAQRPIKIIDHDATGQREVEL
jgi:hypothetical protein